MRRRLLHTRQGRMTLLAAALAVVAGVLVWRAPDLDIFARVFDEVAWEWVAVAIGMNLLSVMVRSIAWHIVLNEALPPPHPSHRNVFSAFCVGLLGNAVLPGRAGEVARMAVVARHVPHGRTTWASIFGSTFAHRLFDLPPTVGLVIYVLMASRIPRWAEPGVEIVLAVGGALLLLGLVLAWWGRRNRHERLDGVSRVRRLWHMLLRGLRVFHSPGPAFAAAFFQLLGWVAQVFAVYFAFKAFQIDEPLAAAALVLLVANVALAFPLWPGSVGLFQAAVALSLVPYGVAYRHGFAYGIGLQAIEASVGIGLGLIYLAREGISFAMLKQIPRVSVEDVEEELEDVEERERKPVPGREDADRLRARHAQGSSLRH
jgi:glycosyltransferase 2 family protein